MSEHHSNVAANMAAAGARHLSAEILIAFSPKGNVVILPKEKIREGEGGAVEILGVPPVQLPEGGWRPGKGDPVWHAAPEGTVVVAEGSRVGVENLDVVVNLVATAVGGMVGPDGRVMGRRRQLGELFREDAQTFMASIGGGGPPS